MDEIVIIPLLLGFLAFLAIGALMGWLAFARSRETQRRLEQLERKLREMSSTSAVRPSAVAAEAPPAAPPAAWRSASVAPSYPPPIAPQPTPAAPIVEGKREAPPPVPEFAKPAAAPEWSSRASAGPAPTAPPVPPPSAPRKPAFDLERWIGVRGAAVLGGVFLIIAGFLFLQYSIERNWVTPEVRLTVGAISGVACIIAAMVLRKRGYGVLSSSLAGAGVVLLYAVAWAAHKVYGRIEFLPAFGAMVAVTAFCAWLSYRHSAQLIAVLGFVGGFATPLALSTGQDRPLGLFGYSLLLDLAFLFVAHKRRWPSIAIIGLLGSFLLQGLWAFAHMEVRTLPIGLVALGVFGLLFAVFAARQPSSERARWIPAQAGALLLPFVFVLYFAQQADLGWNLAPLAALAAVMAIAAGVMARMQSAPWLSIGAAAGSLALVLVWSENSQPDLGLSRTWQLVISSVVLSAIPHGFAELARRRDAGARAALAPACVSSLGFLLLCVFIVPFTSHDSMWPWVCAWLPLALLLLRQAALGAPRPLATAGTLLAGTGFALWAIGNRHSELFPRAELFLGTLLGFGAIFLLVASRFRAERRTAAFVAACVYGVPALSAACNCGRVLPPTHELVLLGLLGLALIMALAASGARSALLFALAASCTLLAQWSELGWYPTAIAASPAWTKIVLLAIATLAMFVVWPFARASKWNDRPGFWRVAAAASLPWYFLVHTLVVQRHGPSLRFAPPLGFALFLGACAMSLWKRGGTEVEARERAGEARTQSIARAWFSAVALWFASFVVPLHVDHQAPALGLAIFAAACAWLWTRCDHRGLKLLAVAAIALATLLLVLFHAPELHERAPRRIANWNAYLLLLPAVAAGLCAWLLHGREVARARGLELQIYARGQALAAGFAGACCVLLAFVWLNLEVADAFSSQPSFHWSLRGDPKPSLAISIAWAVYALLLLGLGVRRGLGALRWASLALLLLTIAKVFLMDLAHLDGLYRVASMLGLALSLLLVSFFYQRFVFRRARVAAQTPSGAGS